MLGDLVYKVLGAFRSLLLWLDSIGFAFLDDAYELMIAVTGSINQEAVSSIVGNIVVNAYVLVGIFALFRLALSLINSIISPDKLTEEKKGFGSILVRLVVTMVLFIFVPVIFQLSRDLQKIIIDNNYISKFIAGVSLYDSEATEQDATYNPGTLMQLVTIKAIIRPDDRLFYPACIGSGKCDYKGRSYDYGAMACDGLTQKADDNNKYYIIGAENDLKDTPYPGGHTPSAEAIKVCEHWNNNQVTFTQLARDMDVYDEIDGEKVWVYNYYPIVSLIVGLFMVYVLLSFAIDIAVRSIELLALEILSPFFIITYIDPNSSSNGPFKRWLTAAGKSYASLFIKIAVISLMLLFISNLSNLFGTLSGNSFFVQLLMILAILIFAKKAPKWIGDMIGLSDGAGLGGLGIGKKLAGAALVGGMAGKAFGAGKDFAKKKGKNFLGNRARNVSARIGAMHEQRKENKKNKELGQTKNNRSIWQAGRAAAKKSRAENWGRQSEGFKDFSTGFLAGRQQVNPNARGLSQTYQDRVTSRSNKYNAEVGFSDATIRAQLKAAEDDKTARAIHGNLTYGADGKRNQLLNFQGARETAAALGGKFTSSNGDVIPKNALTEQEGYLADMKNHGLVSDVVMNNDGTIKSVTTSSGKILTSDSDIKALVTDYKSKQSLAKQDAIKLSTATSAQTTQNEYYAATKQTEELTTALASSRTSLASSVKSLNETITNMSGIKTSTPVSYTKPDGSSSTTDNVATLMTAYLTSTNSSDRSMIETELKKVCPNEFLVLKSSFDNINALQSSIGEMEKQQDAWAKEVMAKSEDIKAISAQYTGGKGFEPKDNPLAIEVNGKWITAVGEYEEDRTNPGHYIFKENKNITISSDSFVANTGEKVSKIQKDADKSLQDALNTGNSGKKGE